jgi:hypothetical protein
MGASFSSNIANSVTRIISKVSTSIIQNTQLTEDQTQIISVTDVDGDVHISGNTFIQTATINMQALMNALSSSEAQQSIIQELAQEAKSITAGLNIAQFADSENILNTLIEAEISLITEISQNCFTSANQYQEIIVQRIKGNVFIQNNIFNQMYNILDTCAQQSITNNKFIQDALNKVSQSSSATSQGISEWALLAGFAIFFGLPIAGATIGGVYALKYIFPLILIIGLVLIIIYFYKSTLEIELKGYSKLIQNTPSCLFSPTDFTVDSSYKTQTDAANACVSNNSCKAFDWMAGTVQPDGSFKSNTNPEVVFFNSVSKTCQKTVENDASNILYVPKFFNGETNPISVSNSINGDIYLNSITTEWFQMKEGVWKSNGMLTSKPFNLSSWGTIIPITKGNQNDIYFYANPENPSIFSLYRFINDQWIFEQTIVGPGLFPKSLAPPNINASGFKTVERNQWLLYGGITGIVIGAIGTFWTLNQKAETKNSNDKINSSTK